MTPSCNCEHSNNHDCNCHQHENKKIGSVKELSETEIHFLTHLVQYKYLPVAQFVLKSSKESDFESIAFSPVFITETSDTMEQVRNFGAKLKSLEDRGFLTLDFDIILTGYSYDEYYNSNVFSYFKSTVEETKGKENFLGDVATIQTGSICPTEYCIKLLK